MIRESGVIAVVGARRLALVAALIFWALLAIISGSVVLFKAAGACMALTLMDFGPFQPPDSSGPFYLIAAFMIYAFSWLAWICWKQGKKVAAALAVPLVDDVGNAANLVKTVEVSGRGFLATVRSSVEHEQSAFSDGH